MRQFPELSGLLLSSSCAVVNVDCGISDGMVIMLWHFYGGAVGGGTWSVQGGEYSSRRRTVTMKVILFGTNWRRIRRIWMTEAGVEILWITWNGWQGQVGVVVGVTVGGVAPAPGQVRGVTPRHVGLYPVQVQPFLGHQLHPLVHALHALCQRYQLYYCYVSLYNDQSPHHYI